MRKTVKFFHVKCKYEQNDCELDKCEMTGNNTLMSSGNSSFHFLFDFTVIKEWNKLILQHFIISFQSRIKFVLIYFVLDNRFIVYENKKIQIIFAYEYI